MDVKLHKVVLDANTLYFAFKHNHSIIQYFIKTIESNVVHVEKTNKAYVMTKKKKIYAYIQLIFFKIMQ
jgi:hypothetical protein